MHNNEPDPLVEKAIADAWKSILWPPQYYQCPYCLKPVDSRNHDCLANHFHIVDSVDRILGTNIIREAEDDD